MLFRSKFVSALQALARQRQTCYFRSVQLTAAAKLHRYEQSARTICTWQPKFFFSFRLHPCKQTAIIASFFFPFSFLFLSFFFPFLTYCIFVQHPSPEMRPEKHTVFSHSHLPVSIYHLNSCTIFSLSTTYFLSQLLSHNYSLKTHINFSG